MLLICLRMGLVIILSLLVYPLINLIIINTYIPNFAFFFINLLLISMVFLFVLLIFISLYLSIIFLGTQNQKKISQHCCYFYDLCKKILFTLKLLESFLKSGISLSSRYIKFSIARGFIFLLSISLTSMYLYSYQELTKLLFSLMFL